MAKFNIIGGYSSYVNTEQKYKCMSPYIMPGLLIVHQSIPPPVPIPPSLANP